ncbi:MAG: cold shock domain-containing protein [Anaerolineales bacterium]|nr:cold shock domain-containing protein [Anaerolineales bacterium]MCB9127607.1 cold shock domain-containing protein [Ardenticatenales bacterium]
MTAFRDQLLTCDECGGQFVFTVGEQRHQLEETGQVEAPAHCPVCAIKLQRQGTRPEPEPRPMSDEAELPAWLAEDDPFEDLPPSVDREPAPAGRTTAGGRQEGLVKWFNNRKGFGFISLGEGDDLFVHYSGIAGEGYRSLAPDQRVSFEIEETEKGPQAVDVEVID